MNIIIYFLALISMFTFGINAYPPDFTDNVRDEYNRYDPDSTLNGFFPLWGIVILILSGFFLVIAACGLIGYLVGCRTPPDPHHHPSTDSTAPFFVIQNFRLTI